MKEKNERERWRQGKRSGEERNGIKWKRDFVPHTLKINNLIEY